DAYARCLPSARGRNLSAHARQALMPRALSLAGRVHRRALGRRHEQCVAHGSEAWVVLPRLLLGAHAAAVLRWCHEPRVDRAARGRGAGREAAAVGRRRRTCRGPAAHRRRRRPAVQGLTTAGLRDCTRNVLRAVSASRPMSSSTVSAPPPPSLEPPPFPPP